MLHYNGDLSPTIGALLAPETSDGDVAIAAAALLDAALLDALLVALPGDPRVIRDLVRPHHQRKTLAYALGLITYGQLLDLRLVGRIRNNFAHDIPRPTFDSRGITLRIQRLGNYRSGVCPRRVFLERVAQLLFYFRYQK